jgi:hypothetical protein
MTREAKAGNERATTEQQPHLRAVSLDSQLVLEVYKVLGPECWPVLEKMQHFPLSIPDRNK